MKHWSWQVTIDTTKAGMERCMRALLMTGSWMTDSGQIGGNRELGRGVSSFLCVQIYEGKQDEFFTICKPIEMRPTSRIQIGTAAIPDDGHPGRKR